MQIVLRAKASSPLCHSSRFADMPRQCHPKPLRQAVPDLYDMPRPVVPGHRDEPRPSDPPPITETCPLNPYRSDTPFRVTATPLPIPPRVITTSRVRPNQRDNPRPAELPPSATHATCQAAPRIAPLRILATSRNLSYRTHATGHFYPPLPATAHSRIPCRLDLSNRYVPIRIPPSIDFNTRFML